MVHWLDRNTQRIINAHKYHDRQSRFKTDVSSLRPKKILLLFHFLDAHQMPRPLPALTHLLAVPRYLQA